jgi:hypothetical protein
VQALIAASLAARIVVVPEAHRERPRPRDGRRVHGRVGAWCGIGANARLTIVGFRRSHDEIPLRMLALVRNVGTNARQYVVTVTFADAHGNRVWGANVHPAIDGRTPVLDPGAAVRMEFAISAREFAATTAIVRFRHAVTLEPVGPETTFSIAPPWMPMRRASAAPNRPSATEPW